MVGLNTAPVSLLLFSDVLFQILTGLLKWNADPLSAGLSLSHALLTLTIYFSARVYSNRTSGHAPPAPPTERDEQ